MDEDEEMWFDQDEPMENGEEAVVPQQDQLNNTDTAAFKPRKTLINHSDNKGNKVSSNNTSASNLKSKKVGVSCEAIIVTLVSVRLLKGSKHFSDKL